MPTTVKKDRDLSAAFGSVGGAHWATEPGSHMDELAMASRRHSGQRQFISILRSNTTTRGKDSLTHCARAALPSSVCQTLSANHEAWDFPGDPVLKNPPSNAGDAGAISGGGTKFPHSTGQLESPRVTTRSPCTVTRESVCGNEDLSTAKEKY